MNKYILTVLDTSGIQPYIFATNRLQEIIGASQLVREVTRDWVYEALESLFPGAHNVQDTRTGMLDPERKIEEDSSELISEVVYAGGGNTVLLFRSDDAKLKFTRQLSDRVLRKAPGINLLVAHKPFAWDPHGECEVLAHKVREAIEVDLAYAKQADPSLAALLGLGITAACEATGLPAVTTDEKYRLPGEQNERIRLISREVAAKLDARNRANQRLREIFRDELGGWYEFPNQLDELGRREGEESYIAVVHADGNGMGARVKNLGDRFSACSQNRDYINAIREFSDSVRDGALRTIQTVVAELARQAPEHISAEGRYLPFRPLIFGGDDTTFVCSGELGLALAARYLDLFETQKLNGLQPGEEYVRACAGVSIVKMHYPFARAYRLAEELCKEAKREVRDSGQDYSALDWHISASGLSGDLEMIRSREYILRDRTAVGDESQIGNLTMRPVRLHPVDPDLDGRAWFERLENLVATLQEDDKWAGRRNKMKALRQALRGREDAVVEFLRTYREDSLPEIIPGSDKYRRTGWYNGRCGYFDAIELMDHYLELK